MSETYEQPRPGRKPAGQSDPTPPTQPASDTPADDDAPGLSPALESEGGGENRRDAGRPGGVEGA